MNGILKYSIVPFVLFLASCGGGKTTTVSTTELTELDTERISRYYITGTSAKVKEDYKEAKLQFNKCLNLDKNHAASLYQLAEIYKLQSIHDSALDFAIRALKLAPANKWYKEITGDLYWINRKRPEAISLYESLLQEYPGTRKYYFRLNDFYDRENKKEKQVELVKKEIAYFGSNTDRVEKLSNLLLSIGKNEEAENLWLAQIEEDPLNEKAYEKLGRIYFFQKDQTKLEKHYATAFDKIPYSETLTKAYIDHVLLAKPIEDIRAFLKNEAQPNGMKHYLYSKVQTKEVKMEIAQYLIDKEIANDEILTHQAVYLEIKQDYEGAVQLFQKVSNIEKRDVLEAYFRALLEVKNYTKANEILTRLEELYPFSNTLKSYRTKLSNAQNP